MGLLESDARHDRRVDEREVVVARARAWRGLRAHASAVVDAMPAPGLVLAAGFFFGACLTAFDAAAAAEGANAIASGVIVRLRDAAPNVPAGADPRSLARSRPVPSLVEGPDAVRWARLLAASRLDRDATVVAADLKRTPALEPVGRAAQLLRLERRLYANEAQALVERLAAHPDVAWAVPNTRESRLQAAPNLPGDPLFAGALQQWWLQPAGGSDFQGIDYRLRGVPGFQSAWRVHRGSAVVAVLDTGVTAHEELNGRLLPGYDFVSDWDPESQRGRANDGDGRDADPTDPGDGVSAADRALDPARYADCDERNSSWHGTTIAGMLAGATNNGAGVAAMQWDGRVVPVRVAGKCGADLADVIDGMRWAAGLPVAGAPANPNPARIVSISFGGDAPCNAAYLEAIDDLARAPGGGAVLLAAAGNNHGALVRPASCDGAIGVVALNRDGFKSTYSSFGAQAAVATVGGDDNDGAWGDLLADSGLLAIGNAGMQAPGAPTYARVFGTSFSAPVAAGVAALMVSANPQLTAAQVREGLRRTARAHVTSPHLAACGATNPGRCACATSTCGAGILDAEQAVLFALDPTAYVKPATPAAVLDNADLAEAASRGPDRAADGSPPPTDPASTGGGALDGWSLLVLALVSLVARRTRR
jgi:serine protease